MKEEAPELDPHVVEKAKAVFESYTEKREVVVEIGPGHGSGLDRQSLTISDKIDNGALYIAVDNDKKALGGEANTKGAVAYMSLLQLARSDYLDGRVNLLYVGNVFGDIGPDWDRTGFEEEIFKKFYKMLAPGGKVVVVEGYTPATYLVKMRGEFDEWGLPMKIHIEQSDIKQELAKLGLSEGVIVGKEPFLITLEKPTQDSKA